MQLGRKRLAGHLKRFGLNENTQPERPRNALKRVRGARRWLVADVGGEAGKDGGGLPIRPVEAG